jgi:DNA polymerase-4
MGAQETFGRDIDDRETILREVLALTAKVAERMRVAGVVGRTVSITVRFADFTTITRARTLPEATDLTQEIYRAAVRLYDALGLQRARLRLVGVRVEGLVPRTTVHRQGILGERERGWPDADRAVDRATRRFGSAAVRPASLLDREERRYAESRSKPSVRRSERPPGPSSDRVDHDDHHPVG